jgi:formylglycine-generating enzyme required for sulfatase activity
MKKKHCLIYIIMILVPFILLGQEYKNFLGMRFISLEAGSYTMGSCNLSEKEKEENRIRKSTGRKLIKPKCPSGSIIDETATDSEIPKHLVKIGREFQIGIFEVTLGEFKEYLKLKQELNNSEFHKYNNQGDNFPVVMVSWEDLQGFIKWLNKNKPESDLGDYRLPTEAEWEFACRAGTNTIYCFGNNKDQLGDYAWFEENSESRPHTVGHKKPNNWGIYDMHGNVWEWVQDWFDPVYYSKCPILDPQGPKNGTHKVVRGGGCYRYSGYCRSAYRYSLPPDDRHFFLGFRLVRVNY